MPLGIVHDHDNPLVIVVPLAGPAATETLDLPAARPDVVDLDIEVDADLCGLRLCHSLNVSRGRSSRREPTVAHPASSPCSPVMALFSSALQKDASRAGSAQSIVIPISRFVMQAPWHPGSGARTAAPADPHTRSTAGGLALPLPLSAGRAAMGQ